MSISTSRISSDDGLDLLEGKETSRRTAMSMGTYLTLIELQLMCALGTIWINGDKRGNSINSALKAYLN